MDEMRFKCFRPLLIDTIRIGLSKAMKSMTVKHQNMDGRTPVTVKKILQ
jgi:hypothetical protein